MEHGTLLARHCSRVLNVHTRLQCMTGDWRQYDFIQLLANPNFLVSCDVVIGGQRSTLARQAGGEASATFWVMGRSRIHPAVSTAP